MNITQLTGNRYFAPPDLVPAPNDPQPRAIIEGFRVIFFRQRHDTATSGDNFWSANLLPRTYLQQIPPIFHTCFELI